MAKKVYGAKTWYGRNLMARAAKSIRSYVRHGDCVRAQKLYDMMRRDPGRRQVKSATWKRLKKEIERCKRTN